MEPTSSGTLADQLAVPVAAPVCPVFVDHVTEVTPTLSLAVPLNAIVAAAVETDVAPGDVSSGTRVEMVFRIKDTDELRGFKRYFWKATPVSGPAQGRS